jgi:hypothetical protein
MLKHKLNKLIKIIKKKTKKILPYGRKQKQESQLGNHHGAKEDLDGIFNVLQWLFRS